MPWCGGKKRVKRSKRKISSLPLSARHLWEFRSLTPHTLFEPKGSYDRCTVLTRKRWMLSEEKRIGLSSQKMRERGKREKSQWNCLSFVHVTLRSVLHSNSENKKSERERESWIMMCHNSLFHSWDDFQRGMCVFFWHRVTYVWRWFFLISLTHKHI